MRFETKIGAAITIVALGAVAGFVAVRGTGGLFSSAPTTPVTQGDESLPEPVIPASVADAVAEAQNSGTSASPPPIGLGNEAERSFRPKEVEPAVSEPQPAPAERIGLSELPSTPPIPEAAPAPVENTTAMTPPPAPEVQPAPSAVEPPTKEHVIEPGDNFSLLAVKYYGNAKYANLIAKANPDLDPRRLMLNTKIKIPPAPAASPATPATAQPAPAVATAKKEPPPVPADRAYKVQPGESWNDLGKKFLGDGKRWPELYELNKERVPRNPQSLRPGVTIEVPATKPS